MRLHRILLSSLLATLLLSAIACNPPESRVAGTWKNDWAIEHGDILDKGGLVFGADGTMTHSVFMMDGSSAESKGTYEYVDGFLVVTETESFKTDPAGIKSELELQVWGGQVTFLASNEIEILDPINGPITLIRHK